MLDTDGIMIEEKHRTRFLLAEVPEDASLNNECSISKVEAKMIDSVFEGRQPLTMAYDISSLMIERNIDAKCMVSIGATYPCLKTHFLDDDTEETDNSTIDSESSNESDESDDSSSSEESSCVSF